ncbi:ESCRT-0 subunit protein hse1 [Gnomoniopsis smithogilvyi]|uniref:Class E vacuolar protein-sorting machinery protein HSE1 n=1 Tax=Gnomoniopsis smithogilvyi TaxID=1191159 RepID=A0A9W8YXU0_9PEZI|nr:ESCRT-0 subunit protein hse1 [Gnomoniopsis smithogilvyi]
MFRAAAPGPYDEAIAKATDENLTSEDWAAIMEVCDRVSGDSNGSQSAVQALIKRLAHRNANVQLYTLELANALSQNCGQPMHRELASRAFTDALLKLANDRNTHNQVKAKIMERMKEWSDMFSKDADLGIMYDAYYRLKQSNPQLQPPSAPQKTGLTDLDRQKEEDELQIALKLSLQEEERKKQPVAAAGPSGSGAASQEPAATTGAAAAAAAAPIQPMPSGTTAATVSRVRALYDFVPSEPGELEFKRGDVIAVLESVYKDWWRGSLKGKTGIFPLNYVEKLTDPTPEELQREAQMEAEVFAEIKNVEKLLTLLSTNTAPREEDNEEISKLYHQTLAIRPKLIKLIEKYSQKKDDFTQLNEKFIKARRDYEALLEQSMSHPPQPNYQQYAMRPAMPQGYGGPSGPGYQAQGPHSQDPHAGYGATPGPSYPPLSQAPEDPQRFYTPAPAQDQQQPQQYPPYPPSQHPQPTPSPAFQRPGATPAPFYMAGAEVPAAQQNYPPRDPAQRVPSGGKPQQTNTYPIRDPKSQAHKRHLNRQQTTTTRTSDHPTTFTHHPNTSKTPQPSAPYDNHPSQQQQQRPQSYAPPATNNPQELATSVYDSPIAPHNPHSAATYTSSTYSPEEPSAPSYAPPSVPGESAPPPLNPSGPAYDARQGLPSQGGTGAGGGGSGQYKAYAPPSSAY